MKKLLTVSLFAIMAVSAANADIASTEYVGDQITATAGTLSSLTTDKKGNLVEAINEIDLDIVNMNADITEQMGNYALNDDLDSLGQRVQTIEDSDYAKSGITSTKVAAYEGYAATIAANTAAAGAAQSAADAAQGEVDALETVVANNKTAAESALSTAVSTLEGKISEAQTAATYDDTEVRGLITTNANDIDAIKKSEYATSGVTAAVVGQVTTNQNAIATINDSAVMNSGVTADVVATANSAMQETALKGLATWTSEGCNAANATCSLVSKNGSIAWEKVSY